jgi:hypothetical protein
MRRLESSVFLRRTLLLDGAFSGAAGVLLCAAAGLFEPWMGLPSPLLRGAGLVLLPFASAVVVLATRHVLPRPAVLAVIAANVLWVGASIAVLLTGHVAPTLPGIGFVVVQAVAVLGFAELQWMGLRRTAA